MNTLAVIGLVVVAFALGWITRDDRVLRDNERELSSRMKRIVRIVKKEKKEEA